MKESIIDINKQFTEQSRGIIGRTVIEMNFCQQKELLRMAPKGSTPFGVKFIGVRNTVRNKYTVVILNQECIIDYCKFNQIAQQLIYCSTFS